MYIERAEWKCHLAFLVPVDCICWSLTAIDKFKMYAEQFTEFAISSPHTTVNTSTTSTAVILWGLMRKQNDSCDIDGAPEVHWQNINLKLIFQGIARSIVHIKYLQSDAIMPRQNEELSLLKRIHLNDERHVEIRSRKSVKRANRWLPALPCRSKEFTGT